MSEPEPHRNVTKVIEAGRALGVRVHPHTYPQGAKTTRYAADAIGVEVGQIVKSLVFGVQIGNAAPEVSSGVTVDRAAAM